MDTIRIDGVDVRVYPITMVRAPKSCPAIPLLKGHRSDGSEYCCEDCQEIHAVTTPVHTYVTG